MWAGEVIIDKTRKDILLFNRVRQQHKHEEWNWLYNSFGLIISSSQRAEIDLSNNNNQDSEHPKTT
jgi:hypothetical protein